MSNPFRITLHLASLPDALAMRELSILGSLESWMTARRAERERVALEVAERLPSSFHFDGLVVHDYAGLRRIVARFVNAGRAFALLPGVRNLVLGYDPAHLKLDEVGRAVIADEAAHAFDVSFEQHLEAFLASLRKETSPRRRVSLPPFLISEIAEENEASASVETIDARLAKEGFRLPSEDEWEYACGAGRDAYFKWGERVPCEAWPPGNDPTTGDVVFADAVAPNAFGLTIAHDPYRWEYCDRPGVYRGGDGGTSWCGGEGSLAIWRALGVPYRCVVEAREITNPFTKQPQKIEVERQAAIRRVFPLARVSRATVN